MYAEPAEQAEWCGGAWRNMQILFCYILLSFAERAKSVTQCSGARLAEKWRKEKEKIIK
jgi:hypothetical protein